VRVTIRIPEGDASPRHGGWRAAETCPWHSEAVYRAWDPGDLGKRGGRVPEPALKYPLFVGRIRRNVFD
jgi:hypothetical protein